MTDGANVNNDKAFMLVILALSAVNLYITWQIASGLQSISNTAGAIGSLVKGL